MPRFKLTIEYDGSSYVGWQRQAELPTVQSAIEAAIYKLSGQIVTLTAAGRTDAGVHALGQIAHVDLEKEWCPRRLREGLNAHLVQAQEAVAILDIELVPISFDARFSAQERHYVYHILNRRAPAVLELGRVWWVRKALQVAAMDEAAKSLLGCHDFSTFRAAQCQAKSPIRTLRLLNVVQEGEKVFIYASARSFLHKQVRSIVGSLVQVGLGSWTKEDLIAALEAKNRAACGQVAPPQGLYFHHVDY